MVVEDRRNTGIPIAINGVFGNLGVACAALVTGFLIDIWGWRSAFVIPGLLSVFTGILYWWFFLSTTSFDSPDQKTKDSIKGIGTSSELIGKNVVIQDGSKIGVKGFGFIPIKNNNFKFPHIGRVIIEDNVEIASGCTIDRGSVDDTKIGKNTYLDNQVHIAHNNKIGDNCIIAGQVGFAGSSTLGNNVMIGGQAGISGHLKVGNNVQIGGGSGVINDIPDNTKVMGYPAKNLREFIKDNR